MLKKCNNCNEMVVPDALWIVKKGITYKEVCTQCKESFKSELEYEVPKDSKENKNDIMTLASSIESLTSEIRNLVVLIEKISKR